MKRGFLVAVGLALLAAPGSAHAADPHADVTFFSHPGHFVGAGWEQRWSSEDERDQSDVAEEALTLKETGKKKNPVLDQQSNQEIKAGATAY